MTSDSRQLLRSLGRPTVENARENARTAIVRVMMALYDQDSQLSDTAFGELQKLLGWLLPIAQVRLADVIVRQSAANIHYAASHNGGSDPVMVMPGVTSDKFTVTGGHSFQNQAGQWYAIGTIESTGETAWLFVDPRDESKKEMVILEEGGSDA